MKYNFITEPSGPKSVTVITPTIGQKHLIKAIESVHNQTYMNVKHLVVVDGLEYFDNVNDYDLSKWTIKENNHYDNIIILECNIDDAYQNILELYFPKK